MAVSGHGLVTARGGRAGHCTLRAGDKAERSEVWVTDNKSRAKQGVCYAMLVDIKGSLNIFSSFHFKL